MSTNNIKDVKTVDSENFDYLLAESNFRIESVFRSRNKAVIEPNVPVTTTYTEFDKSQTIKKLPNPSNTKTGATFSYIIDASEYQLLDLRDAEFDIQAQYAYYTAPDSNTKIANVAPVFGNQCLLSLFQNIELFIDGVSIARNAYPGFSSNAEYALRYPHCKTLEKDFEVHGFNQTNLQEQYNRKIGMGDLLALTDLHGANDKIKDFDNQSITLQTIKFDSTITDVLFTGVITQRIRLSDIFSVVNSLPPIYNHKIEIRFQRTPHNYIVCNTCTLDGAKCEFYGFNKFKLFEDIYNTTDQFVATAKQYYSKPIETLITQDRQLLVPIISIPQHSQQQSFNLNIDTAYKNKLLTICIPRTTDFASQYNKVDSYYTTATFTGANNADKAKHYDYFRAPANSYTYGGLRYLDVASTNGLILYRFDMENDGVNTVKNEMLDMNKPITMINVGGTTTAYISNYEDVYRQYVKARLHFQQSEDEALDFETFLKEYCIFCIDLSCFNLSPNENIKINMGFSAWDQQQLYNPYYQNNTSGTTYMSSSIICNLFCDKVLRLLPNRRVELADLMTTNTVEVDNSNMA